MSVENIVKKRRTARVFSQTPVDESLLENIIDLVRLSPSGANLQPLKYAIITDEKVRESMFPHIKYAGYIKEFNPTFNESPKAFIGIFCDTEILGKDKVECDAGISLMAITLLAEEKGLSSCILGAINRVEIAKILDVKDSLSLLYLIGLGYAESKGECYDSDENVKYTLNNTFGFNVPKRKKESVIIKKV